MEPEIRSFAKPAVRRRIALLPYMAAFLQVASPVEGAEAEEEAKSFAEERDSFLSEAELEEMPIYETVVRDERPDVSAGTTSISRETIESARPTSADEIVALVPGVKIVQHGAEGKGHQIFMQGFDAAHGSDVEGLLEGVSLNEPSHVHGQGYLDLYGVIPEVVSKVSVFKGPFLPWQGDFAVAGSMRFELGVPEAQRPGFVSAEGTHRGKARTVVVAAPSKTEEETFAAADVVRDLGFGPDRSATRGAFLGQYRKDFGRTGAVTALASLQNARFESPETLRLSDVENHREGFWGAYEPAGRGLSDRALMRVAYRQKKEGRDIEVAAFGLVRAFSLEENFTGRLLYPERGDLRRQEQKAWAGGVSTSVEEKLSLAIPARLLLGMGWRYDGLKQRESQLDSSRRPWQVNRRLGAAIHQGHWYAGARLGPAKWMTILPSLRLAAVSCEVNDRLRRERADHAELAVLPRLSTSFPIHRAVTLFANYGRGYRSPESRAIAAPPQETIEDERLSQYKGGAPEITMADSFEAGVKTNPVAGLLLDLFGFATFLDHEMVFDHVSNLNVAMDGTRRIGVTAAGSVSLLAWLALAADVTWTDARFNRSGNRVPGVPIWMGSARLDLGREMGPKGGMALSWCGTRPLAHGAETTGYARLDASAGWRFAKVDLAVVVENALNQKIMEGVYHFASWFDDEEQRSLIPSIHYAAGKPITARFIVTVYL